VKSISTKKAGRINCEQIAAKNADDALRGKAIAPL